MIESPDRKDDFHNNLHEKNIESKYHSIKQAGNLFDKAKNQHGFSMAHFNMRSLSKNLPLQKICFISLKKFQI
jgi:hypothetical protein